MSTTEEEEKISSEKCLGTANNLVFMNNYCWQIVKNGDRTNSSRN